MKTLTSVDAQNHFGALLDAAQREPVTVTRRGRPVAFVISPADMRDVIDARSRRSQAVDDFQQFFERADAQLKPAAYELTEREINALVDELR